MKSPVAARDRLIRDAAIRHQKRKVFGRVARRMDDIERDVADCDAIPMRDQRRAFVAREAVLPALIAVVREIERRPRLRAQLAAPGKKIRVDVRLGDVGDPRIFRARGLDVLLDVAVRVDDHRLARLDTPDQIARLRQFRFEEPFDEHGKRIHSGGAGKPESRTPPMPRYKLTLEYAGTRYSGWQIQKNAKTVQGELHRALGEVFRSTRFETYGAGRTDAGVHALGQVAHVDTAATLPPDTLVSRVNESLPADINVLAAERVPPRFHARHSAVARSYVYQISQRRTAFGKPFVWWVREDLDVEAMRAAARALVGFSDFRAFTDDDPDEKSTRVAVEQVTVAVHGALILVRVVGSHFLWKMVRRMTGVLVLAGRGELAPGEVPGLLGGDSDLPARSTAPASGLFLERVFYETPPRDWSIEPPLLTVSAPADRQSEQH